MKIRYIGKARIRVEGVGEFGPGEEREVKDGLGAELCRGGEFREAPPSGASRHLPPQAGAGTAAPPLPAVYGGKGPGVRGQERHLENAQSNETAADEGETVRKGKNRKSAQSNETAADDTATREG